MSFWDELVFVHHMTSHAGRQGGDIRVLMLSMDYKRFTYYA